jgi:hypothetical protein
MHFSSVPILKLIEQLMPYHFTWMHLLRKMALCVMVAHILFLLYISVFWKSVYYCLRAYLNRDSLCFHLESFVDAIFIGHELEHNAGIVFCLVNRCHWLSLPCLLELIQEDTQIDNCPRSRSRSRPRPRPKDDHTHRKYRHARISQLPKRSGHSSWPWSIFAAP